MMQCQRVCRFTRRKWADVPKASIIYRYFWEAQNASTAATAEQQRQEIESLREQSLEVRVSVLQKIQMQIEVVKDGVVGDDGDDDEDGNDSDFL